MPPLIRRSQSAVPGTPARTAATQALGPTRRPEMALPVMLAPRCTGRSRNWPFPMGCSRVWAGVVKTLASELGPAPVNGLLPVRIAADSP
jgi:hypothetical protein